MPENPYDDPFEPIPIPKASFASSPPTSVVAEVVVLDWHFTVYVDGSMKITTPPNRPDIPELKIALGPRVTLALWEMVTTAGDGPHDAIKDFGGYAPGSLGQSG